MRLLIALAIAGTSCSSVVDSAELPKPAAYNWTGFYVGADIGYAVGGANNDWRSPGAGYPDWEPDGDISFKSASGAVHIGYLKQFGNLALGIEADISRVHLNGDDSQFAGLINTIDIDYVGTVRGRVGIVQDSSLFYVTGGFAFSDYTKSDRSNGWSSSENLQGWTIGSGYETAFASGLRARIEYQYVNLGSINSFLTDGAEVYYYHRAQDLDIHNIRAGLSYGF